MPLLELKSNLSKVNTNFGSDTTTAGNTTSFSYDSLHVSTLPSTIDIAWDTTPISNYKIGLQVVKILEASQQSIKNNGVEIFLENN